MDLSSAWMKSMIERSYLSAEGVLIIIRFSPILALTCAS